MRALIISEETKADIAWRVKFAESNVVSFRDVMRTANYVQMPIGDDPNFVLNIEQGFRVVFSIEKQPAGISVRHLSVSVDHPAKSPSIPAVEEILRLYGFQHPSILDGKLKIDLEKPANGRGVAINIWEKIK